MSIRIAESAGFCFGVSRAVETVEKAAAEGKKVVTLGPIIHNRHVVDFSSRPIATGRMGVRLLPPPVTPDNHGSGCVHYTPAHKTSPGFPPG